MNELTEFINAYQNRTARFHMPGHKGNCSFLEALGAKRDITEIAGADDLYHSHGCIESLEKGFSSFYGTEAVLSAGGSTLCIQTILALLANKKILAARNAHGSFMNGCALCGVQPEWIPPAIDQTTGLTSPPTASQIKRCLEKLPRVNVVYITSPDYYGQTANVQEIARLCSEKNILLAVDNAHGAHLHALFPSEHPIAQGAHLCCDSLHKTLPALTGAALLHAKRGIFSREEMKKKMALFGSTSPSYLIMESAGLALDYLNERAKTDWQNFQTKRNKLIESLQNNGYTPLQTEPSKLVVDAHAVGRTGNALSAYLHENCMETEYADNRYVVLMLSPFNADKDLEALADALIRLPKKKPLQTRQTAPPLIPKTAVTLRDAVFHSAHSLPVEQAAKQISAENLFTCPPGVPILLAGEEVTPNIVNILKKTGIKRINVLK